MAASPHLSNVINKHADACKAAILHASKKSSDSTSPLKLELPSQGGAPRSINSRLAAKEAQGAHDSVYKTKRGEQLFITVQRQSHIRLVWSAPSGSLHEALPSAECDLSQFPLDC